MFRFDDAETLPFRMPEEFPQGIVDATGGHVIPKNSLVRAYGSAYGVTVTDSRPGQLVAVRTAGVVGDMRIPEAEGVPAFDATGALPTGTAIQICPDLELLVPDAIGLTSIPGRIMTLNAERGTYSFMIMQAGAGEGLTAAEVAALIQTELAALVGSAPETLDTIEELSAALQDDPDTIANIFTLIGTKQDATAALAILAVSDPQPLGVSILESDDTKDTNALLGRGFTYAYLRTGSAPLTLNPGVVTRIPWEGQTAPNADLGLAPVGFFLETMSIRVAEGGVYDMSMLVGVSAACEIDFEFRYIEGPEPAADVVGFDTKWPYKIRHSFPGAGRHALPGLFPLITELSNRRILITAQIDGADADVDITDVGLAIHKIA